MNTSCVDMCECVMCKVCVTCVNVTCAGRARQSVRLLPVSALESGESKNVLIKVAETEGEFREVWTPLVSL